MDPGIFDSFIISPPAHSTLIANEPVKIEWAPNGTGTTLTLYLRTYTGYCEETPNTHAGSCAFSDTLDQVLNDAPDTGEAMWTPSADLESRNDYMLSGYQLNGTTASICQQGFYTILKRKGDTPIMLPTPEEINRNLTKNAQTSSSVSTTTSISSTSTYTFRNDPTTTINFGNSAPTSAAEPTFAHCGMSFGLLLYTIFAHIFR